ncbi:hypothetical protein R1sor_023790 [Riccia sorocarpa]|uniref:Plant heme peroxidase family profile domain-containing protein n=1 Tax=Riccia sorocarpa TaxID=122646 RepID=A0ABD3GQZ1_9MARC
MLADKVLNRGCFWLLWHWHTLKSEAFDERPQTCRHNLIGPLTGCYPVTQFIVGLAQNLLAPALIIRLAFHDCAVNGCDASILLNGGMNNTDEKLSARNLGILGNLNIIDGMKAAVERACPGVVSCSDLIVSRARILLCWLLMTQFVRKCCAVVLRLNVAPYSIVAHPASVSVLFSLLD